MSQITKKMATNAFKILDENKIVNIRVLVAVTEINRQGCDKLSYEMAIP